MIRDPMFFNIIDLRRLSQMSMRTSSQKQQQAEATANSNSSMRILAVAFALSQFVAACEGVAFDSSGSSPTLPLSFLGVVARGGAKANAGDQQQHDPEKATSAILNSIKRVEKTVQKAVEDEIHAIFHDLDEDQKAEIVNKAQKAVEQGTAKVKKELDEHAHPSKYPFEDNNKSKKNNKSSSSSAAAAADHKDQRILHAVEAAELAVLNAVENEVDALFFGHEMDHHHDAVKIGVKKATEKVEQVHQHRRDWMTDQYVDIQDYMEHDLE
jgi:hypothetical protein